MRTIHIITFAILLIMLMSPVQAYEHVQQGGIVYLNDTMDISGVLAGYSQLVYTDPWSTDFSVENDTITYVIEAPVTNEAYYSFYINPAIFSSRLGYWYRYNGAYESNANNRAFYVKATRPLPNETINETEKELMQLLLPPPPPVVPEKHVADYLLARGDSFNVTYNWSKASVWIFGRVTGIYDRNVINGTASFNASETAGLEPGSYSLVYYSPGPDRQYDMRISDDGNTLEYFDSATFKVRTIDLKPLSPRVVLDRVQWIAGVNDDNFTVYKLEVQEPKIEITTVNTLFHNEYDPYNETGVIQVRGYTNLANNTPLSFVLDETKTPAKMWGQSRVQNRWNTTTLAVESPGSYRYFDVGIPVDLRDVPEGPHNITAYGPLGAKMSIEFWRYTLPEGIQRPNQTVHYIGGYEFVPTPTPITVVQEKIVERVVNQVVEVTVTPSDEQVHAQQDKIWWESASTIAQWGFFAIVIIVLGLYLIRYYYGRKDAF